MRWALLLADFDFEVVHVPGSSNQAADSLSRDPAEPTNEEVNLPEREIPPLHRQEDQEPVLFKIDVTAPGEIQKWQEEDPACRRMRQFIRDGSKEPQLIPAEFKACYKGLRLDDNVLKFKSPLSNQALVPVAPRSMVKGILEAYHDDEEAGHPGREETLRAIRQRFFWVNMHRDIAQHVRTCLVCACTKASNRRADSSMRGRRPYQPWEVIAVDLMGPYPRTARGKTQLLVVTDLFTRWLEAFPIPEATTGRILAILRNEIFSRYGYPRCLLSDNGSQFTSHQWKRALEEWKIEHWTTPIYHPRANPTERRNQELKRLLRIHLLDDEHKKWDVKIPQALFAIRQRVNRVTGYSPAELFLGRRLARPGDWELCGTAHNFREKRQADQREREEEAKERIVAAAEKIDAEGPVAFEPGQLVFRRNHILSDKLRGVNAGLAPRWLGPYEVENVLGKGVYLLRADPPIKVHSTELKPADHDLREHRTYQKGALGDEAGEDSSTVTGVAAEEILPRYNLRPRRK